MTTPAETDHVTARAGAVRSSTESTVVPAPVSAVVDGLAITIGRTLTPGSYACALPGEPRDLAAGPAGATVFYLHLDVGSPHAIG